MTADTSRGTPNGRVGYELKVSAYERVSGLLVALLVLVGLGVGILFLIWLTNRIFARPLAVPVLLENIGVGGNAGSGLADTAAFDETRPEELMQDLGEAPLGPPTALALLDSTISQQEAALSELSSASDEPTSGRAGSGGGSAGSGAGDGGEPGIPRWQRWVVRYESGLDLQHYAQQLDFFGIELGVVRGDGTITYVSRLSSPSPQVRKGPATAEQRLYMAWQGGELQQADRSLLRAAGVDPAGARIVHFYPPELENRLALIERDYAGRAATEIRRTQFGVRRARDGYEMYVIDQAPL